MRKARLRHGTWRFRPHAHTCGTSPRWMRAVGARVSEASADLCRLVRTRRASSVKLHTRAKWSRWSKPGLSEQGLGTGNRPTKWQVEPMACSRAVAADGSVDAVLSCPPFDRQFAAGDGGLEALYAGAFREMARVLRPGTGRAVLLLPEMYLSDIFRSAGIERRATVKRSATASRIDARRTASD